MRVDLGEQSPTEHSQPFRDCNTASTPGVLCCSDSNSTGFSEELLLKIAWLVRLSGKTKPVFHFDA